MAKAQAHPWEVTDEFWSLVEPLVPAPVREGAQPRLAPAAAR